MEMKKKISIVLMVSLFVVTGCVRYYKTSSVNSAFSKAERKLAANNQKAEERYAMWNSALAGMTGSSVTPEAVPYPAMKGELAQMKRSLDNMKGISDNVRVLEQQWQTISKGKSRIQSDKPEWKELKNLRGRMEEASNRYRSHAEKFRGHDTQLQSLANSHGIKRLKTEDLVAKLVDFESRMRSGLTQSRSKISEAESQLRRARGQGYSAAEIQRRQEILDTMKGLLRELEAGNSRVATLRSDFEREAGGNEVIWAGPGMKSHTLLVDMEKKGREIEGIIQKLDSLSDQYKKD